MDSDQTRLQQQLHTPTFAFSSIAVDGNSNNSNNFQLPPTSNPSSTMNGNELPNSDAMDSPNSVWMTPTSQPRPRPATIHEGFSYCFSDDFASLQSWDSPALSYQQTPSDIGSRPVSMQSMNQDFFSIDTSPWTHRHCDDGYGINSLDSELPIGHAYTTDEAIPVLDLKHGGAHEGEQIHFGMQSRRMSGSSFTMSTSGALSDIPSCDDFSTALSEAPSFSSDYPPPSNRNSLMSSTHLSPVASPRMTPQSRTELVRSQSRGRASPSPRPHVRSAPYSVESSRNKRWSTGSYSTPASRRVTPFMYNHQVTEPFMAHQHPNPSMFLASQQMMQRNSMLLPSQIPSQVPSQAFTSDMHNHFEAPAPLLSHGLFRMLQSNADPHSLHGHYTDLSDPPDLFASLHEEQIPPPPEDMNPSDPDMVPHEQELRFEGDLYTPRWVRGHGNKREGWCGICKPGRWLVLKNSAFWYDKSFTHGISAATGSPFQEPQETRRMDGNPDVWEGLCGSCNDWIALVSSKKKGTTWFRHAYKCHTHPKVKDAPKRRREGAQTKILAAATMAKPKMEEQLPITPQSTPSAASAIGTPTSMVTSQPQQQGYGSVVPPPMPQLANMPPTQLLTPGEAYPNMI
jgi:hypothetical protein